MLLGRFVLLGHCPHCSISEPNSSKGPGSLHPFSSSVAARPTGTYTGYYRAEIGVTQLVYIALIAAILSLGLAGASFMQLKSLGRRFTAALGGDEANSL